MIAGLGNPGSQYAMTRHNTGFMAVDALASNYNILFKPSKTSLCEIGEVMVSNKPVLLMKPLTYMNNSGEAVSHTLNYYDIQPSSLLVIHDDIDMPLGSFKFTKGGGAGGHNGIRSIINFIGTNAFPRLKIGIGRPAGLIPVDKYVLSAFTKGERDILQNVLTLALEGIICFIKKGLNAAMNEFNGKRIGS
jgi:PTH1 family peptidyl-tRNA hydrolase